MIKKTTLLLTFLMISFFVKLHGQAKMYSYPSSEFNETSITKILDESRKNGTQEWEIEVLKNHLYQRLANRNKEIASGTFHKNLPPAPSVINGPCTNIGFDNGTTSGWTLTDGNINSVTLPCNTCASGAGGIAAITTASNSGATWASGVDACSGQSVLAPIAGNVNSVCLNNKSAGGKMQAIQQTFLVSATNNIFTYEYLAVLQDGSHPANAQPYFFSQVSDASGNPIPCTQVQQSASGSIPGWINSTACSGTSYKGWVGVTLDLTSYIGQNVTIQFLVSDCNQGGHYGYCYIDALCDQEQTSNTVAICPGSTQLCGQAGFATYSWIGPVTGNTQCLTTSTPGNYTLTATGQCPAPTRYYTVTISPTPTVNFSYTATPCNYTVPFTDQSTVSGGATISGWAWTFGESASATNTSTLTNPSHTYVGAGTYNVVLTCTSSAGCVGTYSTTVTISAGPTAAFTASTVCPGNPTVFTTTSTGTYSWDFGEPSSGASNASTIQNPTHTYAASGSYVATLSVSGTGTCVAVATNTIIVSPSPTAIIKAPTVCLGTATVFTSTITPATGVTYNWTFGDGGTNTTSATPTNTYGTASTFPVTLTVTTTPAGCTVTATTNAIVNPLPTASFTVAQVCQGTGSVFANTSSLDSACVWTFGGIGNPASATTNCTPTYTYSNSGTFAVTLTVTAIGGCKATATGSAVVNPMPIVTFTANNPCEGTNVTFNNLTTSQGSFSNWLWTFGDGGNNNTANPPAHSYTAGCYPVVLTATTTTGCSGTYTSTVYVHPKPGISFTAFEVCLGDSAKFVDSSYVQNPACLIDNITNWNWNYGDGTGAHVITNMPDTLKYLYAQCGPKTISYTVTTSFGCTNSVTLVGDTIFCPPFVTAPASLSVCPGGIAVANQTFNTTVTNGGPAYSEWLAFSNYSGMPAANITTGGFNVVPGYSSAMQNLTCSNLIDTVAAIAISSAGCLGNIDFYTVTLHPTPILKHMDSIKVCANQQVVVPSFTVCPTTSTIAWTNNTISIGLAASGNGNVTSPFTGLNTTPNVVDALITVTPKANGCVGPDSTFNIVISPLPAITSITSQIVCPTESVVAPIINTNPQTGNVILTWTATNYAAVGLPASSAVNPNPFPYAAPANTSLINQIGIITYTPTLNGCVGSPKSDSITIKPTPTLQAVADQFWCPAQNTNAVIFVTNPSPAGAITTYTWSYTTPISPLPSAGNTNPFPSLPTLNSGQTTLVVAVTVTATLNGCVSPPTGFNISVYPNPVALFSSVPVCQGQPMNFTDLSTPNSGTITVNSWAWDMNNDGIYNDATTQNPSYPVSPAGIDSVRLFVSTSSVPSCKASITQTVTVYPNPVPNFTGDSLSGCPVLNVRFTDASTVAPPSTITSYSWNFGVGAIPSSTVTTSASTTLSPVPVSYNNLSETVIKPYTVSLTVISTGGCTATKTKNAYINVFPTPKADFDWTPKNADIDAPAITFVNQAIGAGPHVPVIYGQYGVHYYLGDIYAYSQSSNYVDTNRTFTHSYDYYQPETYTVTQWVINSLGCKDSIKKEITIGPNFTFYIPNAFSPNGDGTNEGFKGTGIGIKEGTYNLWVFDRWGNMIFYSDDLEKAWDGHMKGNTDRPILQEDVYVWKVNFHDFTGKKHDFHGTVTLIK